MLGEPPGPPGSGRLPPSFAAPSALHALVLSELRDSPGASIGSLVRQYEEHAGSVLESSLPYESRPNGDRKVAFENGDNAVVMVAHAMQHEDRHQVALCSGFALNVSGGASSQESVFVSCAHTLEEMRNSSLLPYLPLLTNSPDSTLNPTSYPAVSGSFILTSEPKGSPFFHPVKSILSSLHHADLLLLSTTQNVPSTIRSLPVSPYPARPGTPVRAHFVVDKEPKEDGWRPWVGGTWSKWVKGTVLGYRDFAGREAQPGTYDALSHMLFRPLPTPGSSGGPIIDEETGAVVGVMLGTRMDSRVEGVRGWGVPSELIFEMFSLPGLNLKSSR